MILLPPISTRTYTPFHYTTPFRSYFLVPPLVFNVETVRIRTCDVEYAHQRIIPVQRHHQFGARRRVAGDVAVERIDVGHALGIAAARRRAAHALVERD